jgi:hypothetical protein
MIGILEKTLVTTGSSISILFGVWHYFVPEIWKWNSYIDPAATELIIAVRAINIFFSLSLVLFGIMNILVIHGEKQSRYSLLVILGATCILWTTRVVLQFVYPQGTMNPLLQYGIQVVFIIVLACYLIPTGVILASKA